MEKLLVINPGSTSTKIAVYHDAEQVFLNSVPHSTEQLKKFDGLAEQYGFRRDIVLQTLAEKGYKAEDFTCVVGRGGILPKIKGGPYRVNEDMVWQLRYAPILEHASNLGGLIAYEIAEPLGIPAYIYDAVGADEMPELNKITGWPDIEREGLGHNLNTRAIALRYAKERGRHYKDISVVVAHLGGGFTVNLHYKGVIVDVVNDDSSGFTPERAGALPMSAFVRKIFREGLDEKTIMKKLKTQGGLTAYLGSNDSLQIEEMIEKGDERAKLVYEAMIMNIARDIAGEFPIVNGDVEAILLTGGLARSDIIVDVLKKRLSFLNRPIMVYAGENEMQTLAEGGLRVLSGEETAKEYKRVDL